MAISGGKTPWDASGALTGPARTLWFGDLNPTDLWDIIPAENTDGEYPAKTGYTDFGLAANAPVYTSARTTTSLVYQQPSVALYETINTVDRKMTIDIGQIDEANLRIIENATEDTVTIAPAAHKSGGKKIGLGTYDTLNTYGVAMVSFRPSGAEDVTEGDGTVRPSAAALICETCRLTAASSAFTFERGKPTSATIDFTVYPTLGVAPGLAHGYWFLEDGGTILDV